MGEQKRRQEELEKAFSQFTQAVARGQLNAFDRFGQSIEVGDRVLYHAPQDLIFEVMAVDPVLDRAMPPGLMRVMLQAVVPMQLQVMTPFPSVIVLRKASAATQFRVPPGADGAGVSKPAEAADATPEASETPAGLVDEFNRPLKE